MQNCRLLKLTEVLEIQPEGARSQRQPLSHLHQLSQVNSLQRYRPAPTQAGQVRSMTMKACNHGQAGKAALGRLGLQHHRNGRAAQERNAQKTITHRCGPYRSKGAHRRTYRIKDPLNDAHAFTDNVRLQGQVWLKWDGFPVGNDNVRIQRSDNPIGGGLQS